MVSRASFSGTASNAAAVAVAQKGPLCVCICLDAETGYAARSVAGVVHGIYVAELAGAASGMQ